MSDLQPVAEVFVHGLLASEYPHCDDEAEVAHDDVGSPYGQPGWKAAGGAEVDALHFDKKHPYESHLSKYEWFSGKKSSHVNHIPVSV